MLSIKSRSVFYRIPVLLLLITALASCGGSDDAESIVRAKDYIKTQELSAASLELKNVLLNNAYNAEARYLLAEIYLEMGDALSAEKEIRRALDAGWDEAQSQRILAEVMLRQGKFKDLLEAIRVKDNYPKAIQADLLGLRAVAYNSLGQLDDAIDSMNSASAVSADALWALQSKARLAIQRSDLATVKETLVKALLVYPEDQDLWMLSAGLADKENDYEAADAALQKVIDLDPPGMMTSWGRQARTAQFRLWFKQQDLAKAQAAIDPVLKVYSGSSEANYLGALLSFAQRDYDLTEERLQKVLRANPSHREAMLLFGQLSYLQKDFQQAAHYLEKVASSSPEDVSTQTLLGRTYMVLGQYEDAEGRLKMASSMASDDAELLAMVGVSRLKSGDIEAGIRDLEQAAAIAPAGSQVHGDLARAYMTAGENESAIRQLEAMLESGSPQEQTEAMLLMAYIKASKFDEALELADKLSAESPDNPVIHILAGLAHEAKSSYSAARDSYDSALRIAPGSSVAVLGLARLDLVAGNTASARQRYQSLLEKNPKNVDALVALAKMSVQEREVEQALAYLEKAREAAPGAIEPRLILVYYYVNNNVKKAKVYADETLKIAPNDPLVQLAVGRVQLASKDPAALQTLGKLAERLPNTPDVHFYLAQAKAASGDLAGAYQSLQKAIELKPGYVKANYALGNLELGKGDIGAALKIARQMKKEHPQDPGGYLLEGDALMKQGKYQSALSVYKSALPHTKEGAAVIRINKAYRANGQPAAGYDELNQWLKKYPDDLAVRSSLASASMIDGRTDDAMMHYEYILDKQPDNPAILNDLAWLYNEKGKPGALEMAARANKLAPDNAAIQDTYGWLLVQGGRAESGLLVLEKAAAKLSSLPSVRYHLAVALSKTGDNVRAKKELNAILQQGKAFPERSDAEALLKSLN